VIDTHFPKSYDSINKGKFGDAFERYRQFVLAINIFAGVVRLDASRKGISKASNDVAQYTSFISLTNRGHM